MQSESSKIFAQETIPISNYWRSANKLGLPFALWRSPKQLHKQLILSFNPVVSNTKLNLEETNSGFAISPFLNPDGDKTLLIEADVYLQFDQNENVIAEQHKYADLHPKRLELESALNTLTSANVSQQTKLEIETEAESVKNQYLEIVKDGISQIEAGKFQKVVLSRKKEIEISENFQLLQEFDKLCTHYPNAFVSLIYLPQLNQCWLGATPEMLVSIDKQGMFRTMSLAGTQSAIDENGQLKSLKQAQWTQKEIEEQAYVSRFIIDCLKKIRVREFIEEGPKTVMAGNLMHLRTDFTIDTQAIHFPQLGTVMLDLLHPTSAVCGMPKNESLQFILENEKHDREFYAGYLGPVNIQNETELYVNLRCMKIENHLATLYAGAGITEDSDPMKEWLETELKCQTLLKVFST